MPAPLTVLSSMATRQLLDELAAAYTAHTGQPVRMESVGGVDAARRVRAGEVLDLVVLASNVIDALIDEGHLRGPRIDIARSGVYVAVRAGAPHPDIRTEAAVREAVRTAASIGTSTGPSGTHLAGLFERWGIADEIRGRVFTAKPGVPVGSMIADGRIALGFQQRSELTDVPGVDVLGPLPDAIQLVTVFSAGVGGKSGHLATVRDLIAFLTESSADAVIERHAMQRA